MELRLNANAVITSKEGKFLLVRLKGGPFAGGLCIPGGGIRPGEFSPNTIRREIKEETGIELDGPVHPFGFCEIMKPSIGKQRVVLLLHSVAEGTPVETEEGIAKWMTYEEAEKELIPFAKEAIKIWREKEFYFTFVE